MGGKQEEDIAAVVVAAVVEIQHSMCCIALRCIALRCVALRCGEGAVAVEMEVESKLL